ncbi:hypothetical protein [Saudi moumouvirus]|nr:hypothetical protein [Saudi moumouvirus]
MIRLNDKPDINGNVHLLANLKHKHYVKFKGIQSDDSIDSFHKFMLDNGVWDPDDKVVKLRKPMNFMPRPEFDNISVVLKFYNLGVMACENKMKLRQKEQMAKEQGETEYRDKKDISNTPQINGESIENLHTTETTRQRNGIVLNVKGKINTTDEKPIPVLQLTNPNIPHVINNNTQLDNNNNQPGVNETPRRKSASFGPIPCEDSDSLDDVDDLLNHEDFSDYADNDHENDDSNDSNDDSNDESPNEDENDSDDSDNQGFIDVNIPDDNIIEFENKNKSDKNKSGKKSKLNSDIIAENKKSKSIKQNIISKPHVTKNNKKSTKTKVPESDDSDDSDDSNESDALDDISDQSEDFSHSDSDISNSEEDISSDSNSSEDELPKKKLTTTKKAPQTITKKPIKTATKKPVKVPTNTRGSKTSKTTPKPASKTTKKPVVEKISKKPVSKKSPETKKKKPGRPKK